MRSMPSQVLERESASWPTMEAAAEPYLQRCLSFSGWQKLAAKLDDEAFGHGHGHGHGHRHRQSGRKLAGIAVAAAAMGMALVLAPRLLRPPRAAQTAAHGARVSGAADEKETTARSRARADGIRLRSLLDSRGGSTARGAPALLAADKHGAPTYRGSDSGSGSSSDTGGGTAAATAASSADGSTSPAVLPPLSAYSTATGPDDPGIYIPTLTALNYADVWTPVSKLDQPLFWHIPRSGGTTVQGVLGHCLRMVQASDLASHVAAPSRRLRPSLDVFANSDGLRYVNVDATTKTGLDGAKRLGLARSRAADVVITHLLHHVSYVFDYAHRGRAFALFRHPVKRAVSMFYSLQKATWEPTYDASPSQMTLLEYAHSDLAEENWVVRSLTNDFDEPLGVQHVEVAKEILRRKVIVGIMEAFDQSMVRFEQYFGWWPDFVANDVDVLRCQGERMANGDDRNNHPSVSPSTEEFRALADRNWADVELYHYAKVLFQQQAVLV